MKTIQLAEATDRAAAFLRAVAHPARLRVVCALLDGERSAGELVRTARMRAPALSQHAAILEARGLISRRRQAQSVLYRLAAPEARALAKFLYATFCRPSRSPERRVGRQVAGRTA